MLRIKSQYAHASTDGRECPIGLSIVREDGVRLVADLTVAESAALITELAGAMSRVSTVRSAPITRRVDGKRVAAR